jgi:hypothetical protein
MLRLSGSIEAQRPRFFLFEAEAATNPTEPKEPGIAPERKFAAPSSQVDSHLEPAPPQPPKKPGKRPDVADTDWICEVVIHQTHALEQGHGRRRLFADRQVGEQGDSGLRVRLPDDPERRQRHACVAEASEPINQYPLCANHQ